MDLFLSTYIYIDDWMSESWKLYMKYNVVSSCKFEESEKAWKIKM